MPRVRKLGVDKRYYYLKGCLESLIDSDSISKLGLGAIASGKAENKSTTIYNRFRDPKTFTLGELDNIAKHFDVDFMFEIREKVSK